MKRTIAIVAAVLCIGVPAAKAALDVYDSVNTVTLGVPRLVDGAYTNAAVDVAGAKGVCNVIIYTGAAHTNALNFTNTVTLWHSTASAGTYTTVTNGAGSAVSVSTTNHSGAGAVTSIKLEANKLKRYLKLYINPEQDKGVAGGVILYSK